MGADLSRRRLVPDGLWDLVAAFLPSFTPRCQGSGTSPPDERAVFTAVVYVLTSGCAWRHLPPTFGVSSATAHPAGSPPGRKRVCGVGCTGRCWTNSVGAASWTGRR
ncbi:transposase [Streptomyces sp. NBC_01803]|uniref:transposase n=1 Tax=Streptomyces sp. NBC_01803 TaxID=2975946 RepID=UPI003FA39D23